MSAALGAPVIDQQPPVTPAVPYVAPWQTGFNRYATQVIMLTELGGASLIGEAVIPAAQWWRLLLVQLGWTCSAAAGSRFANLAIGVPGKPAIGIAGTGVATAGENLAYTAGPFLSAASSVNVGGNVVAQAPVPDTLWPGGTTFDVELFGTQAGDTYSGVNSMMIEVYTEQYQQVIAPAPLAVPLLT